MADPFAIAGSIGLAAGLISFVASTVEKAVGQISSGIHAQQRLLAFQIALQTCQGRVEAWAQQWHGHEETTTEDSRFLWGPEGLREVEKVKSSIQEEQNDILKLLYGRSWLNTHGQETTDLWAGILQGQEDALRQDHPAPPAPSDSKSQDIYIRISTALWKNNLLSTSVDRLKGLVENLETTSRLRFHKAQKSADHHRQPSNEEIGSVVKQHHRMRHLAHALSVAYQNLRPSAGSCELLFTDFDKAEMCRLELQNDLDLTFLMKHSPSLGTTSKLHPYRRLDVRHPLDSVHDSVICDQARRMLRSEPKTSDLAARGHTMRGEFLHISRLEKNQQDFHREDIRLDCMAIAVRIGSWSMLTWDSRWLSGLSSCKIVQMRFGDGETWPVFAPDSCSPEKCTSCHSETRPYLLLAVILAELALACPISITFAGEKACFRVQSTDNSTRFVECYLSKTDLLKEIKSATSWYYGSAVKYCLEQDASSSKSGLKSTYNHAHFYRKVIEPLDRHYRPLRKHIEDHPEQYKYFKQEASRFPVPVAWKGS